MSFTDSHPHELQKNHFGSQSFAKDGTHRDPCFIRHNRMILVVRIWVIQRRHSVSPSCNLLEVGLVVEEGHQGQGGLAQARICLRRFVHTGVSGGNYDYINPALKGRLCRA